MSCTEKCNGEPCLDETSCRIRGISFFWFSIKKWNGVSFASRIIFYWIFIYSLESKSPGYCTDTTDQERRVWLPNQAEAGCLYSMRLPEFWDQSQNICDFPSIATVFPIRDFRIYWLLSKFVGCLTRRISEEECSITTFPESLKHNNTILSAQWITPMKNREDCETKYPFVC